MEQQLDEHLEQRHARPEDEQDGEEGGRADLNSFAAAFSAAAKIQRSFWSGVASSVASGVTTQGKNGGAVLVGTGTGVSVA